MQGSTAFFGGALLGGVLSAACGFDLYGSREGDLERSAFLEEQHHSLLVQLDSARQDRERAIERQTEAEKRRASVEADLSIFQEALANAGVERMRLARSLESAREANRTLEAELERLADAGRAVGALEADLERARRESAAAHREVFVLALRYFSTPRPASDLELAKELLLGRGDPAELRDLVLALRWHSPDLLLSLGSTSTPRTVSAGLRAQGADIGRVFLAPAAAHDIGGLAN